MKWFKRNKHNGWEIPDLIDALQEANTNATETLWQYSRKYPLCALNEQKDQCAIIRKFCARNWEGAIDMLNQSAQDVDQFYPMAHYGLTLVSCDNDGASSHNVILPNHLSYEKLGWNGDTLLIHHSEGVTSTNFQELDSPWNLENHSEEEIYDWFKALSNVTRRPEEDVRLKVSYLEDEFFGRLQLSDNKDWYSTELVHLGSTIDVSVMNAEKDMVDQAIRCAQKAINSLQDSTEAMIDELLPLKNETWLEDGQNSSSRMEFAKEISVYAVNAYEDNVQVYIKANELFWGHEILMEVDAEGRFIDADIVG